MRITNSLVIGMFLTACPAWAGTAPDQALIIRSPAGTGSNATTAMIETSKIKVEKAMMSAQRRSRRSSTPRVQPVPESPRQPRTPNFAAETHPAGIYLVSGGQLVRIEFNVSGQTRTGGLLGTALTWGIAHTSVKVVLQGETARVRTSERSPTFYFYLPDAVNAANRSSFEQTATGPTSPNEFSLIRLEVKRGRREARIARANIGGVQTGVVDRDRIGFRFENPRPGVYAVTMDALLQPGEYSFVMIGSGGASQARFFDFSVQ